MDPNLHLALLAATREDFDELVDDGELETAHTRLAEHEVGDEFVDDSLPSVVWTDRHSGQVYERLTVGLAYEDSLVRSLEGLRERVPELLVLDLGASELADLAPLRGLDSLTLLRVGVAVGASLEPLLTLPALERVAVSGALDDAGRSVLAQLAQRGVLVDDTAPDWEALSQPFSERNLKLAVINHLHGDALPGAFPYFDEYRLDEALLARVLALPVEQSALAGIETLTWNEGGLEVHHLVYGQWDGEDGTFSLRSLAGIEALTGLRQLACFTNKLPEAELDALLARGVVVYDAPFAAEPLAAPHALPLPMLAALLFATRWRPDFPRNFWSWPPAQREGFLRSFPFGSQLRPAPGTSEPAVLWSAQPVASDYPVTVPPALLCAEGEPLERVALRSLEGLGPFARAVHVLDIPLSELASLEGLEACAALRTLRATVTPEADLAPLLGLRHLTYLTLHGATSEAQREVLQTLERRHVVVRTAPPSAWTRPPPAG